MSKLMKDLNNLGEDRKVQGGVIIEDGHEAKDSVDSKGGSKGIYFLSFLIVIMIAFSALSMSASIKTFSQLEKSWADSTAILQTLNKQGKEIQKLQSLVTNNTSKNMVQMKDFKNQMKVLNLVVKGREGELEDGTIAYSKFQSSTENSIEELKIADRLMLKKYISLNKKIKEIQAPSALNLNTY